MPIYVYKCFDGCQSEKDEMHSYTVDPEILCDECGKKMRRRILPPRITFKGPGFHSTDYHT